MSERHKIKFKPCLRKQPFVSLWVLLNFLLFVSNSFALPTGISVESGQATIDDSQQNKLTIQATDRAILKFDSFSIGPNETVQFVQPSANASVLGRVTGLSGSEIFGSLFANGEFVLVNPNGIHFAPSANIQVGSLIASTLSVGR